MKIDDLKKVLRHLVKEEVRRAVADEVNKAMGKVLVEMVKEIKSNNNSSTIMENTEAPATVINTKNQKLNSVLAETARNFKPLQRTNDATSFVQLMDGGFDKIGQGEDVGINTSQEPATNLDFLKQMVSQSPTINQPSALDGGTEVPDVLKKVFKKDFRAIMKKIDEQKNGGGGYIDPSRLLG